MSRFCILRGAWSYGPAQWAAMIILDFFKIKIILNYTHVLFDKSKVSKTGHLWLKKTVTFDDNPSLMNIFNFVVLNKITEKNIFIDIKYWTWGENIIQLALVPDTLMACTNIGLRKTNHTKDIWNIILNMNFPLLFYNIFSSNNH